MGIQWKNAPVFYTVAQVRFNPVMSLETYIRGIQDNLRLVGYPDQKEQTELRFNLKLNPKPSPNTMPDVSPVTRYLFTDRENRSGFVLERSALAFQSTDYGNFERFSGKFLEVLDIVHSAIKLDYSQRIGVRYLDAVLPAEGKAVAAYLADEVLGIAPGLGQAPHLKGASFRHSFSETVVEIEQAHVVTCRALITNGSVSFPPDLHSDDPLTFPERVANHLGTYALLDTDGYFEGREPFSIDGIRAHLDRLHDAIHDVFMVTITPEAKAEWE